MEPVGKGKFMVANLAVWVCHGGMKQLDDRRAHLFSGFTRLDLGAVCGVCAVVAVFVVFPRTVRAGLEGNATVCLNNLRRMGLAWTLYASDNQGRVVNNFGLGETQSEVGQKTYRNWSHSMLDWTIAGSNTNTALVAKGKLVPYHDNDIAVLRCPSDTFVSPQQKSRGWTGRVRSYSMNGFMGLTSPSPSDPSGKGDNSFAPGYRQFLHDSAIPSPMETMVFVEEHPDSINDGYFINSPTVSSQWVDLPASYHDGGGGGVGFADGSAVIRLWQSATTKFPVKFNYPFSTAIPSAQRADYRWVVERMSVTASTLAVHPRTNESIEVVWSANPTAFRLQSMSPETGGVWQLVQEPTIRGLGRASTTVPVGSGTGFFRLVR